ncbi:MAG: YncE family protein, partial [Bacteroidetes bacterium]|nr:YncE family protein [Bacteroidota bacterium]
MYKNIVFLLLISFLISCAGKDDVELDSTLIEEGGIFILNEGNYLVANSSLSYYYPNNSLIQKSLFYKANNVPLGDVAQSLTIRNNSVYVVINNSGLIYGINKNTLEFEGKINGLISPREMIFIDDNKAYVSDLYSSSVMIIDPVVYEIIGSIEIGKSSDCMIKSQKRIFIANWSAYNQTKL